MSGVPTLAQRASDVALRPRPATLVVVIVALPKPKISPTSTSVPPGTSAVIVQPIRDSVLLAKALSETLQGSSRKWLVVPAGILSMARKAKPSGPSA